MTTPPDQFVLAERHPPNEYSGLSRSIAVRRHHVRTGGEIGSKRRRGPAAAQ